MADRTAPMLFATPEARRATTTEVVQGLYTVAKQVRAKRYRLCALALHSNSKTKIPCSHLTEQAGPIPCDAAFPTTIVKKLCTNEDAKKSFVYRSRKRKGNSRLSPASIRSV